MAIKDKSKPAKSSLKDILVKEYKWENYILMVFSLAALALSLLILAGDLTPDPNFPIIGENAKMFSIFLLVVSIIGIGLVISPFIIKAFPEVKKISWSNLANFLDNTARVFLFMTLLVLFFLATDSIMVWIFK